MKKDGHIHTPFCPHGTKDSFHDYISRALALGFTEITFSEHAPLPRGFHDPTPARDSAMHLDQLENYFETIRNFKKQYEGQIKINAGLEVDFIEGFEAETKDFLDSFGPRMDDAILSVHFLKFAGKYDCLDYSPDVFGEMIHKYGSVERVYQKYYETVLFAIKSDLGQYKPRRIGHITLVRKFQKKYPPKQEFKQEIFDVLMAIKQKNYELDYNGAGTAKPLCRETYPPEWAAAAAAEMQIPLVYGSDAHQAKELGQGLEKMRFD